MSELARFLKNLFDTSDWLPLSQNGTWSEFDKWFYVISDLMISSAFFALPMIILIFVTRKNYSRFHNLYLLSALFILLSGFTYLIDALLFWKPLMRLSALTKFLTGVTSWITIISIIRVIPVVVKFRSARELSLEVEKYKSTEELLRIKNRQLNEAQEIAKMGHWEWDVLTGKLNWSHGLYIIYGLDPDEGNITFEGFIELIHPDDRTFVNNIINQAFNEKLFPVFYHRIKLKSGEIKTMHARGEVILDSDNNVIKMIGTGQDVTKEKMIEEELIQKTKKLEMINGELQKFAYIISHDLQEPLRKILTYSLRLKGELNENEKNVQFLDKITNSTTRMQKLIDDVLKFSRLSSINEFSKVDLMSVAEQVISDMEVAIEKSKANIEIGQLHTIEANASQIGQLFQNLISNGMKFQTENSMPIIKINSYLMKGSDLRGNIYTKLTELYSGLLTNDINYLEYCCISIADNGIGFEESYSERIFEVFQRLNSRENYEGTGIGLAICKKIVENHRGLITAHSQPGKGTTFTITLPTKQEQTLR